MARLHFQISVRGLGIEVCGLNKEVFNMTGMCHTHDRAWYCRPFRQGSSWICIYSCRNRTSQPSVSWASCALCTHCPTRTARTSPLQFDRPRYAGFTLLSSAARKINTQYIFPLRERGSVKRAKCCAREVSDYKLDCGSLINIKRDKRCSAPSLFPPELWN